MAYCPFRAQQVPMGSVGLDGSLDHVAGIGVGSLATERYVATEQRTWPSIWTDPAL
jgi:hypothetical protein